MDYKEEQKRFGARIGELHAEHTATTRKLADLEKEVAGLVKVVRSMADLTKDQPVFADGIPEIVQSVQQAEALEVGITDRIRQVLQAQPTAGFQPTDVRSHLESAKFDLAKYSNAMATIHMVLKRLVEQQQAVVKVLPDGKTTYQWNLVQAVKK